MPSGVRASTKEVLKVDHQGRITIPKRMRDHMGVSEGEYVVVMMESGKAVLVQKLDV